MLNLKGMWDYWITERTKKTKQKLSDESLVSATIEAELPGSNNRAGLGNSGGIELFSSSRMPGMASESCFNSRQWIGKVPYSLLISRWVFYMDINL